MEHERVPYPNLARPLLMSVCMVRVEAVLLSKLDLPKDEVREIARDIVYSLSEYLTYRHNPEDEPHE